MRIIKHGEKPKNKYENPLIFCCLNCRCRFEADPGEYVPPEDQYDHGAYCICPECGGTAQEE